MGVPVPVDKLPGALVPADKLPGVTPASGPNGDHDTAMAKNVADMPEWERRAWDIEQKTIGEPADALQQLVGHLTGRGAAVGAEIQQRARDFQALESASKQDSQGRSSGDMPDVGGPIGRMWMAVGKRGLDTLAQADAGQVGTAAQVVEGAALPGAKVSGLPKPFLNRMASGALTGGIYGGLSPVLGAGNFAAEKGKQIGESAAAGGATSALPERLWSWMRGQRPATPKAEPRGPSGASKAVVSEAQRQKGVAEQGDLGGPSEGERATTDFEHRMDASRQQAFAQGGNVESKPVLTQIDDLVRRNPDRKVRSALEEVRQTIKNATESSQAANLPAAGARVTPAQLRAMQGQGDRLTVEMADEVRQSINRQIDATGDKALDGHTKDLLGQIRDNLVGRTPQGYRDYLTQYGKGKEGLKQYAPENSSLSKFPDRKDPDATLASIFEGGSKGADLKDLVSRTAHDPAASAGLRHAYGEWLTKPDPKLASASVTDLVNRWSKTREAAVSSRLIESDHAKAIDSLVEDMRTAKGAGKVRRTAATVGGFLAGSLAARPFLGAHVARDLVSNNAIQKQVGNKAEQVFQFAVGNGEAARLLSQPPTPENLSKFQQWLEKTASAEAGRSVAEQKPRRRDPYAFGANP